MNFVDGKEGEAGGGEEAPAEEGDRRDPSREAVSHVGRLALEHDSSARAPKPSEGRFPGFEDIGPAEHDPDHIIRSVN